MPNDFRAASQASFDGRLMTSAHGVTPLRLPLPAGMPAVELVRPRSAGDAPEVRKVKEAWLADLYVTVDLESARAPCVVPGALQYLAAARTAARRPTRPRARSSSPASPNAFLDGREDIGVDMLDVDVGALENWIAANYAGRRVDILYITFTNANAGVATADYPGGAPDQRERAPVPADDRHRSAGLRAGRLQQRRLEARRAS